jgi:hypothetical protein
MVATAEVEPLTQLQEVRSFMPVAAEAELMPQPVLEMEVVATAVQEIQHPQLQQVQPTEEAEAEALEVLKQRLQEEMAVQVLLLLNIQTHSPI